MEERSRLLDEQRGVVRMESVRYTPYIQLLADVFGRLVAYYQETEQIGEIPETESMALYVEKLRNTVNVLRLRHAFSPSYFVRPGVALATSGFPQFHDVIKLDSDLAARDERLPKLPEIEMSKEMLLDFLMQHDTHPPVRQHEAFRRLQWQIAERMYFESLDLRELFFRFTPGKLMPVASSRFTPLPGRRAYQFSWGCYDANQNQPCVYFMILTQDMDETPLDAENNPEFERFLQTIDNIATRVPAQLAPIAVRLDEAFRGLYPKVLKRVFFKELISPLLVAGEGTQRSAVAESLLPLFEAAGLEKNDFALLFTTEIVVAQREELPPGVKSALGLSKPRQIYDIPKGTWEAHKRKVTTFQDYCILPHRLRQHLTEEVLSSVPDLSDPYLSLLTYQRTEGGLHNVG